MNSPAPAPLEVRRPEATPLSEEQKRNYQKDIDRFEEEKFASRNSFPTKLLGWMLIASLALQISGAVSNNSYDFGGLVFFFVGIGILKGSQSALRFATFFAVPGAILGGLRVAWSIAAHEPLEINREWKDYRELQFWTLEVSPCMYFAAESIVAACAFRLRKIPFWTKVVRWWAAFFGILFLAQFGFFAADLIRQREVRRSLSKEWAAAKHVLVASPGGVSSATVRDSEKVFDAMPKVHRVRWKHSPASSTQIYLRNSSERIGSNMWREHEEWFRLPSGKWGKILIDEAAPNDS